MSDLHGTIHWNEFPTRDVDAAVKCRGNLCGWTFDSMPMGDGVGRIAILRTPGDAAYLARRACKGAYLARRACKGAYLARRACKGPTSGLARAGRFG